MVYVWIISHKFSSSYVSSAYLLDRQIDVQAHWQWKTAEENY